MFLRGPALLTDMLAQGVGMTKWTNVSKGLLYINPLSAYYV